jgi:hypothetical protein
MSAIDLGFHGVLATNAPCSVSDVTHDALLLLYREHISQQVIAATPEEILQAWKMVQPFPIDCVGVPNDKRRRNQWPDIRAVPARTLRAQWIAARRGR